MAGGLRRFLAWRLAVLFPVGVAVVGTVTALLLGELPQLFSRAFVPTLVLGLLVAALIGAGLGWATAERVTRPVRELVAGARQLAAGDFRRRVQVDGPDELVTLARAFNEMAARLRTSVEELEAERERLATVLAAMTSGVLFVGRDGRVRLANPAARRMLDLPPRAEGRDYVSVTRFYPLVQAIETGLRTGETVEDEVVLPADPGASPRHLRVTVVPVPAAAAGAGQPAAGAGRPAAGAGPAGGAPGAGAAPGAASPATTGAWGAGGPGPGGGPLPGGGTGREARGGDAPATGGPAARPVTGDPPPAGDKPPAGGMPGARGTAPAGGPSPVAGTATSRPRAEHQGVVVVLHDVTDIRRLEQVRRDFVANVSHELRTPVAAIQGFAETLLGGALQDDPAAAEHFARVIHREAERMGRLVQDLLDLARLESAEPGLRCESLDLRESARSVAQRWRPRLQAAGLDLVLELPPEPVPVWADAQRLEQVWTNLLENARQHTPEGGTVTVAVDRQAGSSGTGGWAVGEVRDTGHGIPPEALPRIFERFYRVDRGRSRSAGGTGLGLAIVKHVVEAHGGTVEAESAVGRGTTVRFRLPLDPRGASPATPATGAPSTD